MSTVFRRHVALPAEHGAWVFLLLPLAIGVGTGGWTTSSAYLTCAALAGFLLRQPLTLVIKTWSGRRGRDVLGPALVWISVYAAVALAAVIGLVMLGHAYVLALAIPAVPVLAWHLWLISRRAERRQWLVEILAAGTLALAAPAAYWIGRGGYDRSGWLLWGLCWVQSSAGILHVYMRLAQRDTAREAGGSPGWLSGRAAIVVTSFGLAATAGLAIEAVVPRLLFLPFALQWLVTLGGAARPATGLKPKVIGYRQVLVTVSFVALFLVAWHV